MVKRKQIIILVFSIIILMLFGLIIYNQYSKVVDLNYIGEYYYFRKFLVYIFSGLIAATILYFLSFQIIIERKILLACILIAITIVLNLLPTELPFIFIHSGVRYIEVTFIKFKISAFNIILLLFAFVIIQQKLPKDSRYKFPVMSFLSILFLMIIAVDGNTENIFIATLLFSSILFLENKKYNLINISNMVIYAAVISSYYFYKLKQNIHYVYILRDPYKDPLGIGYMKIQDFMIMKSALIVGRTSYKNVFSGETLPTILILFGWGVFVIILGLLLLMICNMLRLASGIMESLSKKLAFSITIYFFIKAVFCILVFLNLLPFFSGGHLPFVGYSAEIVIDIVLMGVYFRCCHVMHI